MASVSETLGIMDKVVDFSVKMPRINNRFDPHPGIATPVREPQDINRAAYDALQNGIKVEESRQEREDTSVKDYKAGKKTFSDMLRKLTESSTDENNTVAAYLKKRTSSTASTYNANSTTKANGTSGKLVDLQS